MPATGVRIEIRNPVPQVRRRATALVTYLPPQFLTDQTKPRWAMAGVELNSWGCPQLGGSGEVDELCDYGIASRQPNLLLAGNDCVDFNAFEIYTQLEHWFVQNYTRAELEQAVEDLALLHRSRIVAEEAMYGTQTQANPSLVDSADTVFGLDSTAVGALAAVENGLATRIGNGLGMIHMSPGMVSLLAGLLVFDATEIRTLSGNLVVADAGYSKGPNGNVGEPGGGQASVGESWIYGSGPVYLSLTPLEANTPDAASFDLATNTGVIDILQYGVVAFEPCSVVAARVTDA